MKTTLITILLIAFIGKSFEQQLFLDPEFDEEELANETRNILENNKVYTILNLYGREISVNGTKEIAEILNTTVLTDLNMGMNRMKAEGVTLILEACRTSLIKILTLDGTLVKGEFVPFAELLENSNMTSLSLRANFLTEDVVLKIAEILNTTGIATLDLGLNNFGRKGVTAILSACRTTPIEDLGLSETAFGEWNKIIDLDELLENTIIASLVLSRNGIDEETAAKIIEATKRTRITFLDLSFNPITGMKIGNALNNSKIINLDLIGCKITNEGAKELAKILPYTFLTNLALDDNRIQADGIRDLGEVIPETLITNLSVTWGTLGKPLRDNFMEILRNNKLRIDELYVEFEKLVEVGNESLKFVSEIELQRCANFTEIISEKKPGYIRHFSGYENSNFTRYQIEEFISNIEEKLKIRGNEAIPI